MSILCPGSYGEFAVTITKECFGAKFQILSVSFSLQLEVFLQAVDAQSRRQKEHIPFCILALTNMECDKELTWFRMTFRW